MNMNDLIFHDLKENNHVYKTIRKPFKKNPINIEYVLDSYHFAYNMTFGEQGEHRINRENSLDNRNIKQIFLDAFEGKLAEFCFHDSYIKFNDEKNISPVDTECWKKNKWDKYDFTTTKNGKTNYIGIKSSKDKAALLLLETSSWIEGGAYKYGENKQPCKYDAIVFVRIKYNFYQKDDLPLFNLLNSMSSLFLSKEDDIEYKRKIEIYSQDLEKKLLSKKWFYDIPGYITNKKLCFIIDNKKIIHKGYYFNKKDNDHIIKAENYYIQLIDLYPWFTNAKYSESALQSSE